MKTLGAGGDATTPSEARLSLVGAPPHEDYASCAIFLPSQKPLDRYLVPCASRACEKSCVLDDTTKPSEGALERNAAKLQL